LLGQAILNHFTVAAESHQPLASCSRTHGQGSPHITTAPSITAPRTLADSSDDENSAPVHFDDTRVPTAAAAANADTSASEDEGEEHVRLEELLTEVEAALQAAQVLPDHVSRIRAIVEARGNRYELARSIHIFCTSFRLETVSFNLDRIPLALGSHPKS
jgi:hypothetical protein